MGFIWQKSTLGHMKDVYGKILTVISWWPWDKRFVRPMSNKKFAPHLFLYWCEDVKFVRCMALCRAIGSVYLAKRKYPLEICCCYKSAGVIHGMVMVSIKIIVCPPASKQAANFHERWEPWSLVLVQLSSHLQCCPFYTGKPSRSLNTG